MADVPAIWQVLDADSVRVAAVRTLLDQVRPERERRVSKGVAYLALWRFDDIVTLDDARGHGELNIQSARDRRLRAVNVTLEELARDLNKVGAQKPVIYALV